MIDWAEKLLALTNGIKKIGWCLLKRQKKEAINAINDLIIDAIELKQWLLNNDSDK